MPYSYEVMHCYLLIYNSIFLPWLLSVSLCLLCQSLNYAILMFRRSSDVCFDIAESDGTKSG